MFDSLINLISKKIKKKNHHISLSLLLNQKIIDMNKKTEANLLTILTVGFYIFSQVHMTHQSKKTDILAKKNSY